MFNFLTHRWKNKEKLIKLRKKEKHIKEVTEISKENSIVNTIVSRGILNVKGLNVPFRRQIISERIF